MIAFRNPLFDGQLRRTLGHGTYGGAELGECLAAAATVADGGREAWYREWTALADRTFAAAESSAAHDHRESARCAFLRASNYYRNAYVFHLEAPLPGAVRAASRPSGMRDSEPRERDEILDHITHVVADARRDDAA